MEKSIRQVAREKATISVYQNILTSASPIEIYNYIKQDGTLIEGQSGMTFCKWLIETTINNKKSYITLLEKYLKNGWKFDRLGKMEQAILLIATCELLESELSPAIVINEAVINAKKFCDEDSYKYINGVLHKVIV